MLLSTAAAELDQYIGAATEVHAVPYVKYSNHPTGCSSTYMNEQLHNGAPDTALAHG